MAGAPIVVGLGGMRRQRCGIVHGLGLDQGPIPPVWGRMEQGFPAYALVRSVAEALFVRDMFDRTSVGASHATSSLCSMRNNPVPTESGSPWLMPGRPTEKTLEVSMAPSVRFIVAVRLAGRLLAAALVTTVAACSSVSYPPAPAVAATTDYRYLIGPLDTINIIVWRNPELSLTVPVRPDGFISTPLVEDLQAIGRNPTDLARELEKALSKYARDPVVTVVVTSFAGAASEQIRIVGEATRPQAIPYRQNMTLLDVMIQVGGLTDFADGNGAVLVRGKDEGRQYGVRLKDLLKRGDISANVDVRPGDVLIIPQSWF